MKPGRDEDWFTLRQASEATGVPVATLRKWALRDGVASYLEETPVGQLRMVSLQGIYRRADELGRPVRRAAPTARVVDITEGRQPPARPDITEGRQPAQPEIPEGTMLVPLDAWTKVLNQLGNLHEAGQQLAEARERAARAETEAAFLRERLAELRAQLNREESALDPETSEEPVPKTSPWSVARGVWAALRRRGS